jgi:hypothetical protein
MLLAEDRGGILCLRSFDELALKLGRRCGWRAIDGAALAAFVKTMLKPWASPVINLHVPRSKRGKEIWSSCFSRNKLGGSLPGKPF